MRNGIITLASLSLFVGMSLAVPADADTGYLTIKGAKSGDIKGEVVAKGLDGQHEVVDFEFGMSVPTSGGVVSGRRVQAPVKFTLRWDKGTPPLYNAAVTNENLSQVVFRRWIKNTKAAASATPNVMIQSDDVELQNARITSIKVLDKNGDATDLEPLVEVTMIYQTIVITHKDGGITATDSIGAN